MRIEMSEDEIAEAIQAYVRDKHGINRVINASQVSWYGNYPSGDEVTVDLTHVMISLPEPEGSF